ncbi:MAG TPA: nucleotidyltransferase family protein [Acidimicrobiales bacterium]|nr:nucleotidyltransferase family protein [Acidimicrobiales bacterium]
MTTLGVLLAAGVGSRFLGPAHKLLTRLGDKTVVRWSIDSLLAAGLEATAIVVGAIDLLEEIPSSMAVIENPNWMAGQATSLDAAVTYAKCHGHDSLVIGLADQPLVPSSAWRSVAGVSSHPIVTASFATRRRPPVRLAREVWPLLPHVGDEGARSLMRAHPGLVREVECEGEPIDIDVAEDIEHAIALLTGSA